jgi:hypothetical protein
VSWSIVDVSNWIQLDSDTYVASSMYGSTLRILRSGLIAYSVCGNELQNVEVGILDLTQNAKTVKYKFDTLLGSGHLRIYDKMKGKIVTIGGWGMAGAGAPCGNNGNIYIIDQDGNITVQCMPQSNVAGNVGFCFYDAKTNYIFCGQSNGATGIYRLNPDGSYNDFWQSSQVGGGAYNKLFIVIDESNIIYASVGNGNTQYFAKGTVSYLFDSWKSMTYVEDGLTSLTPPNIEVVGWDSVIISKTYYKTFGQKLYSTTDFQTFNTVLSPSTRSFYIVGQYLGRIVIFDNANKQITIYNPATNQVEATLTITDADWINQDRDSDLPYFPVVNTSARAFKIKALAYNGQVPMIQFDPTANRVRVIDVLTGNALSGFKIKLFYSRFIYPVNFEPMRDPDYTLTPSDWTSLPNPPDSTRINANLYLTL